MERGIGEVFQTQNSRNSSVLDIILVQMNL